MILFFHLTIRILYLVSFLGISTTCGRSLLPAVYFLITLVKTKPTTWLFFYQSHHHLIITIILSIPSPLTPNRKIVKQFVDHKKGCTKATAITKNTKRSKNDPPGARIKTKRAKKRDCGIIGHLNSHYSSNQHKERAKCNQNTKNNNISSPRKTTLKTSTTTTTTTTRKG